MHVGIIAPEFPPELGGMQTYAFEVARGLVERGYTVSVYTAPHPEGEVNFGGMTVHPVLERDWTKDWHRLKEHARSWDVVHVMNAAYSWVKLLGRPTVISVHGNDFINPNPVCSIGFGERFRRTRPGYHLARWLTRNVVRRTLPKADAIVSNSRYTRDRLLSMYSVSPDVVTIGYVGVSNDFFCAPLEKRKGRKTRLLTVCRLDDRRKNVDAVIRSLGQLKGPHDFEYHIIGDGYLREELERLSHDVGISDRVSFLGKVDRNTLIDEYRAADLFVLIPTASESSFEGFGIVYLEANATGTPVLAARTGGAVEAVEEGKSGYFVDSFEVEDVANAIRHFLIGEMAIKSHECRDHASRFKWEYAFENIMSAYRNAIAVYQDGKV